MQDMVMRKLRMKTIVEDPPSVEFYMSYYDEHSDDMFKKHILMAIDIARKHFVRNGWPTDDVVQQAVIGLCDAIKVWDPEKGAFSTIAYYYINGRIKELGNKKDDKWYRGLLHFDSDTIDHKRGFESRINNKDQVLHLLKFLDEREREMIELRFGLTNLGCFNLKELGCKFDLSREGARQAIKRAIKKMARRCHHV